MPKSEPVPGRQLEVFTGTGRRRTWTAEQEAQIVAKNYVDAERVTAVAHRHFGGGKRSGIVKAQAAAPAYRAILFERTQHTIRIGDNVNQRLSPPEICLNLSECSCILASVNRAFAALHPKRQPAV